MSDNQHINLGIISIKWKILEANNYSIFEISAENSYFFVRSSNSTFDFDSLFLNHFTLNPPILCHSIYIVTMSSIIGNMWHGIADAVRDVWKQSRSVSSTPATVISSDMLQNGLIRLKIPCDVNLENNLLLALSGYRLTYQIMTTKTDCVATPVVCSILGLAHLQAVLDTRKAATNLFSVAMNPYRVMERRERYRFLTGQMYHSSTISFLNNVADVYEAGCQIENVLGWNDLIPILGFSSILGQLAYCASSYLAKVHLPASLLAREYFRFTTGLTITASGLQTIAGYVLDIDQRRTTMQWVHRYAWVSRVVISQTLASMSSEHMSDAPISSPSSRLYGILEQPSIFAQISGVVSGILTSYIFGISGRSSGSMLHVGYDILIQSVLIGITVLMYTT